MATLGRWSAGTTTQLPGTSWAAPNGIFGATQDRNDASAYAFANGTSTVTLPSSGLADGYLVIFAFEFEDASNGRHNPQLRALQASGTGNFITGHDSGFNRDNSEDRSYCRAWAFIDGPSAAATIQAQWRRDTDVPTGGTVQGFVEVIPLYYSNAGLYSSASTACPGGTTPTQITGFSADYESNTAAIEIASSTVTVKGENKRYLLLGSYYWQGIGAARTQRWGGLRIDGAADEEAQAYSYARNGANADIGSIFETVIETASTDRTVDMFVYRGPSTAGDFPKYGAQADGNTTGSNPAHSLVVLEFNDTTEVIRGASSAQTSLATAGSDVDIDIAASVAFNDAASFTKLSNTEITVEQATDVLAGGVIGGGYASSSGARFTGRAHLTKNGSEVGYTIAGDYGRGQQGTQDCWGWSANLLSAVDFAADDTLGISAGKIAGGEAGPGAALPGLSGLWAINLDTMEAASGATVTSAGHSNADAFGACTVSPAAIVVTSGAYSDPDALAAVTVSPGAVTVSAAGDVNQNAFGAAEIAPAGVAIVSGGYTSLSVVGGATVTPGVAQVRSGGLENGQTFGTANVNADGATLVSGGYADPDAFGAASVNIVAQAIVSGGHAEASSFPPATVSALYAIGSSGHEETSEFGAASLLNGLQLGRTVIIGQSALNLFAVSNSRNASALIAPKQQRGSVSASVTRQELAENENHNRLTGSKNASGLGA